MWTQLIKFSAIIVIILGIHEASSLIKTEVSAGVESLGYKIIYGDEDLTIFNEVVSDAEKGNVLKSRVNLNDAIKPLPAQDVKCLMSVDRYCSKQMGAMKSVLIRALKDDCTGCSVNEKDAAGKVIASMMAHDPAAWKLFLTRSTLQIKPEKHKKPEVELKLKEIGEPEDVIRSSKNRISLPGVRVIVKRYVSEMIP